MAGIEAIDPNKPTPWGRTPRLMFEQTGETADQVRGKYFEVLATMAMYGTEVGRERIVRGMGARARTVVAQHSFVFPPQEAVVLMPREAAQGEERVVDDPFTVEEHQSATIAVSDVDGNVVVELDTRVEPPVLRVYDAINDPRAVANDIPEGVSRSLR